MKKINKCICIIFACLTLVTISARIFAFASQKVYANGDYEAYCNDASYCVDREGRGWIYRENFDNNTKKYIVLYSVDKFVVIDDEIVLVHGNQIRKHSLQNGSDTLIYSASSPIDSFSLINDTVYFLSDGNIYTLSNRLNDAKEYICGMNITDFWTESTELIQFKADSRDYSYNISNDSFEEIQFEYSSLGEEILVNTYGANGIAKATELVNLREQFPDGKYWNHLGSSVNNPDGYTTRPCTHHDDGCYYSGSCGCNSYDNAIQCMGYAFKLGHDVSGSSVRKWTELTNKSSLDSVKAGDVIRYKNDNHSIFVTDVDGDKITYTDCNGNGTCKIRWEQTIYLSTLKNSFTNLKVCPRDDVGTYTIKLDPTGGTCTQEKFKVKKGESYGSLPEPEREGYDFLGWYTDETAGTKITSTSVVSIGSGSTLYAHWKIKTYYITFDANGGTDAPEQMSKVYMETITLPYRKPSRKGYSFDSWNTSIYGNGTEYKPSAKYSANVTVTLYAMWDGDEHRLIFDANSGTVSTMSMQVKNGQKYGDLPVPSNPGYTFLGWYTDKNEGTKISSEDTIEIFASQTLYAHWEIKQFTLTFDATGGTSDPSSKQIEYYSLIGTLPAATRVGYTFDGWYDEDNIPVNEDRLYTWTVNTTVFAKWTANKYTVNLDSRGGRCDCNSLRVTYDSMIGAIPEPSRDGSEFIGWYTGDGKKITSESIMKTASDITLYAKWLTYSYTTVFDPCGGYCTFGSAIYEYGKQYGALPTAHRAGFEFLGWYTKDGEKKITAESLMLIAETTTLYAKWNQSVEECISYESQYTVTWNLHSKTLEEKYYPGAVITPPSPDDKQYYVFIGWSLAVPSLMPTDNLEFTAVYQPIQYPVHYIIDSEIVAVGTHNAETVEPDGPIVPYRTGYSGSWSEYAFVSEGISRTPVYTPIEYSITFIAGGNVVDSKTFTVENSEISEPSVPEEKGYSGRWEAYTISANDIVVNAVYTCISKVEIEAYVHILNIDYRTTVKLWAKTENLPDDAEIHWFINGEDQGVADDGSITIEEVKRSTRVSVGIVKDGKVLVMSDSEQIKVRGGFFKIIAAFFKNLFHKLDYYEQKNPQDIVLD